MHRILRVVAMRLDELFPTTATTATVAAAAQSQKAHGLRLHIAAVLRDDVTADERITERLRTMTSARQVCQDLLQDALDDGGTDNITVVVGRAVPKDL